MFRPCGPAECTGSIYSRSAWRQLRLAVQALLCGSLLFGVQAVFTGTEPQLGVPAAFYGRCDWLELRPAWCRTCMAKLTQDNKLC